MFINALTVSGSVGVVRVTVGLSSVGAPPLLSSQFAPQLLTPILMLGAVYLCYEGAEKIWQSIRGHDAHAPPVAEADVVTGAIRTDLILYAEIMVIALNEVADRAFVPRLIILIVVALPLWCTASSPSSSRWTTSACTSLRPHPESDSSSAWFPNHHLTDNSIGRNRNDQHG